VKLAFHPLTPERWKDLEDLFGPRGAVGGCWCMWWRHTGPEHRKRSGEENKRDFRRIVEKGPAPGILAYDGDTAVAWCAVRPRADYPRFEKMRTLRPLDDQPVWSVTCFFVRKGYRRQGLSVKLLEAVKKHVRASGGRLLEGYPNVPGATSSPDAFAWTGLLPAFEQAGFEEKARPGARAIVRLKLKQGENRGQGRNMKSGSG
jgi:GNAT superfamily N-acetyltransferase